jgi:hypothetical protein
MDWRPVNRSPIPSKRSFPGIKRPKRETDHLPPTGTEAENAWSYTSSPPYVHMTWNLIEPRDYFTFMSAY